MRAWRGRMNSNSIKPKEIRIFGAVTLLFFSCLCILAVWKDKFLLPYLFGGLATLGLCFLCMPVPFKSVYTGWQKTAHWIGSKIIALILIIAFILVITPTTLIKCIFGGRPLPLKPDLAASTYWRARKEPAQAKELFYKRY